MAHPWRMFAFELASRLGYIDVDGMLDSIPSPLLTEWKAFWNLNPQGMYRLDLLAGLIASTMANIHCDRKKKPGGWTIEDFTIDFAKKYDRPAVKTSPISQDELKKKLLAFAAAFGAKRKPK